MAVDQTFPKGPAYKQLAYTTALQMFAVSDAGHPGWIEAGDLVDAAVQAAGVRNSGASSADLAAEAAARAAADATLAAAVGGMVSLPVDVGTTVALSAAQAGNALVVLTGTLLNNVTVTVPPATRRQVVQNNTTGPYTLTFRTPNGAGVPVPQGKSVDTFCDGSGVYFAGSASLPTPDTRLPLGFAIPGKPKPGQTVNLVLAMALSFPAGLVGSYTYAGVLPTADMAFMLNRVANGTGAVTPIGIATLHPTGNFAVSLTAAAAVLTAAGDVLQLVAPTTQDATGADFGLTFMAAKV